MIGRCGVLSRKLGGKRFKRGKYSVQIAAEGRTSTLKFRVKR